MNIPMRVKTTSNESRTALTLKSAAVQAIMLCGQYDLVETEWLFSDIVAVKAGSLEIHCYEVEQRDHPHVLHNIRRNLKQGATRTIVICPNNRVAQRISERVARDLKEEEQTKVNITTPKTLYDAIQS